MSINPKHIMIIAGEVSGDIHASLLVQEIKRLDPQVTFSGLGGPRMQHAGVTLDEDLTQIAVVGFVEVLKHYSQFKRIFLQTIKKIQDTKPAAVILVDYPGFNLRLAKAIKKLGIPTKVIYYISPQVWAWKASRVNLIRRVVDQMLVFFEFEKTFYQNYGYAVECVGHPLVDHVQVKKDRDHVLAALGWDSNRLTVGLLPGSREKEIEQLLPVMCDSAQLLHEQFRTMQFIILKAPSINHKKLSDILAQRSLPAKIVEHSYDVHNACDVCLVASGTATLETAILQKPMIVIYKTSLLTWALAKALIKIPYIGLVNIVAGKKIVPECLQFQANAKQVSAQLSAIVTNEIRIAEIRNELKRVRELLGQPGASTRAAEKILRFLGLR